MAAPSTPTGLTVDLTASNAVKLSWDNVADETGFHLWKSYDGGTTFESIADITEDTLTWYDSDCGASTQYYYKISAYNADGESALSASVNTTTLAKSAEDSFWSDLKRGYDKNAIYRRETVTRYGQRSTASMLVEDNATAADEVPAYSQIPSAIPPADGTYVVLSDEGGLSDFRILTEGTGITITDGGAGTTVTISLTEVEKEFLIPLDALGRGATAPTLVRLGSYAGYEYDIGDDSHFSFEVPSEWKTNTDIKVGLHWYCNEAYALNSGEVRWQGIYACTPEGGGETVDAPTHTATVNTGDVNIPATAKHLVESYLTIPAASIAAHDVIGVLLSRVALGAGNNPTAKPTIISVEISFTADKLGES